MDIHLLLDGDVAVNTATASIEARCDPLISPIDPHPTNSIEQLFRNLIDSISSGASRRPTNHQWNSSMAASTANLAFSMVRARRRTC
jgi:hypothetical protein